MLLSYFLALFFLAGFFNCQGEAYEDDYDDDYEDSGSGDGDEYSGSGDDYDYDYEYEDSELGYIPEITSGSLSLAVRAGDRVELPCESKDAEKFVRVWMKEDVMLYTGNVRLNQDERFLLTGPGNSSLAILDSTPADSGQYECRIMVKQTVSITHTLMVTDTFSIQAKPSEGVVMVPMRGTTAIGCKIVGEVGVDTSIVWSRDSSKFRDGTYSYEGDYVQLGNVTLEDAGMYYCTAQGQDRTTKTASIQVQVLFPPKIKSIEKNSLQSGKGSEAELTCLVTGEPRPRVIWYKEGGVIKLTDRIEAQRAGTRHVLVIHNLQESDYGHYMCYATNSMASVQKSIEISEEEAKTVGLDHLGGNSKNKESEIDLSIKYKKLKKSLEKDQKALQKMTNKMENEIEQIKKELISKNRKGTFEEGTFDQAILADLERLDEQYRSLKITMNGYKTKFEVLDRKSQDDSQRLWDNVNELQELTNITTRNIEEIYDKDILRLQNFQNLIEGDFKKMKKDITGALSNGAIGIYQPEETSDIETKVLSVEDDLKKMMNLNKNNRKLQQQFRSDLNTAFEDIDELKKEKQSNAIEIEQLKRYITQLEVEKIEENMVKIDGLSKVISNLEGAVMKATHKMRKLGKNSGQSEKVLVLLKEVQNMKNQMFYLQQSILQLRTQEHLSLVVAENDIGPAYNSEVSVDLEQVKKDIENCSNRIEKINNLLNKEQWLEKHDFALRSQHVEQRFEELDEKFDNTKEIVDECSAKTQSSKYAMADIKNQLEKVLEKQEKSEKERVKHFLLIDGLRKKRKLERPVHVFRLASSFIEDTLKLKDIDIEESSRVEDESGKRPFPIRVKFSNLKDRNAVLKAGRQMKGSVKISEEFTERVKNGRNNLAAFARQQSKQIKTRWALQEDKLYFNKKIYVFNETTSTVEAFGDIV